MADFSIVITVPDAKVSAFVAALRWHYGQVEDPPDSGSFRDRTQGELKALVDAGTINALKDIYTRHQEYLRAQAAIDSIDITG